ncbi:MAG: hypothetical protein BKP49_10925 [Treponema sp. CETP13]|nr:MAG: hypothetical protein BKP49_10925 [Treponema sp. CETP13]
MPLLMLTVILCAVVEFHSFYFRLILLLSALFFGWIGDIFLLGSNPSKTNFVKGVVFFLIGHILYLIIIFHMYDFSYVTITPTIIICLLYLVGIFLVLSKANLPKGILGKLIAIYAVILCISSCVSLVTLTSYFAISPQIQLHIESFIIIKIVILFFGGLLFAISDSVLCFITFNKRFKHSDTIVMLTYILAQFLLALGICIW